MILILFITTVAYIVCIGMLIHGFDKVNVFSIEDVKPKTRFSVVIPFRNESAHLLLLLESISSLNYDTSLYEVLLVDDASEDNSATIISEFIKTHRNKNIKILSNDRKTGSPKKDAINTAIKHAHFGWIITTDADCVVPKYWLDAFDSFIQTSDAVCISAPVTYLTVNTFLKRFQLLDFLSLQGATIGGFGIDKPFMCNGANFAYTKSLFEELHGFKGNDNIASGDDVFFLEKVVKNYPIKVHYLKSEKAIVMTSPQQNLSDLINQRKRWAAKTSYYTSVFGKLTGLLVLVMNTVIVCALFLALIMIIDLKILVYLFVAKSSIDFLLLFKTARFFNQDRYLVSFVASSFIYPFFSVYIAFVSVFGRFKWKGRSFKK